MGICDEIVQFSQNKEKKDKNIFTFSVLVTSGVRVLCKKRWNFFSRTFGSFENARIFASHYSNDDRWFGSSVG